MIDALRTMTMLQHVALTFSKFHLMRSIIICFFSCFRNCAHNQAQACKERSGHALKHKGVE